MAERRILILTSNRRPTRGDVHVCALLSWQHCLAVSQCRSARRRNLEDLVVEALDASSVFVIDRMWCWLRMFGNVTMQTVIQCRGIGVVIVAEGFRIVARIFLEPTVMHPDADFESPRKHTPRCSCFRHTTSTAIRNCLSARVGLHRLCACCALFFSSSEWSSFLPFCKYVFRPSLDLLCFAILFCFANSHPPVCCTGTECLSMSIAVGFSSFLLGCGLLLPASRPLLSSLSFTRHCHFSAPLLPPGRHSVFPYVQAPVLQLRLAIKDRHFHVAPQSLPVLPTLQMLEQTCLLCCAGTTKNYRAHSDSICCSL